MSFPFYKQFDSMDCGPTCLRMIAKHYGRNYSQKKMTELCETNREGASLLGISSAAERLGFQAMGVRIESKQLAEAELPCIIHWRQHHFIVLYKIRHRKYYIADPAVGLVTLDETNFNKHWLRNGQAGEGIALLIDTTPKFYQQEDDKSSVKWSFLLKYLILYRGLIIQLFLGLGIGSVLQLITPFLTQSIVDIGINTGNLNFIYIILIAQIALFIGRISVDFIQSWILLHISTRINIAILTDFLTKLMKLPLSFFDSKMTGDIIQRINDQRTIQTFLTGSTITTVFSLFNLIAFSMILAYYNKLILLVFIICSGLYIAWIMIFLARRRELNYNSFEVSAKNQSNIVQLINGMQEIKLNNCEQQKRWEWEHIQARLFRYNIKTLALSQYQQGGATFINEGKNILITFLSAEAVINNHLTLGAMVALQYIVGQLSSPIEQLLGFIQNFQDAKISLERLNEIHEMQDEELEDKESIKTLPKNKSISFTNITFRYTGAGNEPVLKGLNFNIPQGKTTAIVGTSGSGKTTILKLLLRFYKPQSGEIKIGEQNINSMSFKSWRTKCGIVMQDGFIFSDSIESNIAVGEEYPDKVKLARAVKVANIGTFINELPLGINTKIGSEGNGISHGQRQRILIARAVYKDPEYLFFDEATNSLDTNNERLIMNNLQDFFRGRTVVVVAHRLSTVSNADNIIVLDKGQIIEQGTHNDLVDVKGKYYRLVKDQLEVR